MEIVEIRVGWLASFNKGQASSNKGRNLWVTAKNLNDSSDYSFFRIPFPFGTVAVIAEKEL